MNNIESISGYNYEDSVLNNSHGFLLPAVKPEVDMLLHNLPENQRRIFDLGCGNGSVSNWLNQNGWDVTGIDASVEGIAQAQNNYPNITLEHASVYDDLPERYGQFSAVISLEVIEHLYNPRALTQQLYNLLLPGGTAIISTPYHGYWKNLAMAVTGKMDSHYTALWDHGHIKFFSMKTLTTIIEEAGLTVERFHRVGRLPILGKSMIAVIKKTAKAD